MYHIIVATVVTPEFFYLNFALNWHGTITHAFMLVNCVFILLYVTLVMAIQTQKGSS